MYPRTFLLLQNEGFLLRGCIQSALAALKRSSSAEREPLYAALFNYSIGLERLLKLSLLLSHCIDNKGDFPTHPQIKSFGHDLRTLHKSAITIVERYKVEIPEPCRTDDLDERLLDFLSNFAISGRYFNLDALTKGGKSADPLPEWGQLLLEIYKRDIPPNKQASDEEQIEALADSMKDTMVYMPSTGFDGKTQSYEEFFCDHGKVTLVMPEIVWRFARILYPFQMLIFELDEPLRSGKAGRSENFPHMWEICAFCSEDKNDTLAEIEDY